MVQIYELRRDKFKLMNVRQTTFTLCAIFWVDIYQFICNNQLWKHAKMEACLVVPECLSLLLSLPTVVRHPNISKINMHLN